MALAGWGGCLVQSFISDMFAGDERGECVDSIANAGVVSSEWPFIPRVCQKHPLGDLMSMFDCQVAIKDLEVVMLECEMNGGEVRRMLCW